MSQDRFQAEVMDELKIKEEIAKMEKEIKKMGLELLREPFPEHQISKLPKPTKAQTEQVRADFKAGMRCGVCGGWHHKDVVHLDYVGHAALTDRLLDCDLNWNWKPVEFGGIAAGALDANGGMWIELTVCGVSRLGYGDAEGKVGGNAVKERIGDALRNAAMRFGAALDLWHKGDLHVEDDDPLVVKVIPAPNLKPPVRDGFKYKETLIASKTIDELKANWAEIYPVVKGTESLANIQDTYEQVKAILTV